MRLCCVWLLLGVSAWGATLNVGKPLTVKEPASIQKVLSAKNSFLGKTVQVKGTVVDVCQQMGCWMELVEPSTGAHMRIKVEDGVIVFPKDSVGKAATVE